ncbi:two-pore potassium channel [Trifolium repens]|nr:two-pore potassium channel [Trifolium repens]
MSKRTKIYVSVVVIIVLSSIGTMITHDTMKLHWVDSCYLPVSSVTTVGYCDYSFKTSAGKWRASIWILISTITIVRLFTYLSEHDLQRRSDGMTKWIFKKKINNPIKFRCGRRKRVGPFD